MSPILVRPVREQLEHDRVVCLLQAKYKRRFDVGINPGLERLVPAGSGASAAYPDLVLQSSQKRRKLLGVIEVETTESVNHLEAMSQWAAFGRIRAPFYLYVPTSSIDLARRMCADMGIAVAELWAYHLLGEQMRFTLVQRSLASRARPAAKKAATRARSGAAARKKPTASSRTRSRAARGPAAKAAARKTTRAAMKKTARKAARKVAVKKTASVKPLRAPNAGRAKTASSSARARKRR